MEKMEQQTREIYCCECLCDVQAVLVCGADIYPHREDLYELPFWKCIACKNFTGCHHKTKDSTRPLGVIANKAIKRARMDIHAFIDPLWKEQKINRVELYKRISMSIGYEYHTGEIRTLEEANRVFKVAKSIAMEVRSEFLNHKKETKQYSPSCIKHIYTDLPPNKKYSRIQRCVKCKSIARMLA
jgi:hypothetical protein